MWSKIKNPETGRFVSIYRNKGQNILNNYMKMVGGTTNIFKGDGQQFSLDFLNSQTSQASQASQSSDKDNSEESESGFIFMNKNLDSKYLKAFRFFLENVDKDCINVQGSGAKSEPELSNIILTSHLEYIAEDLRKFIKGKKKKDIIDYLVFCYYYFLKKKVENIHLDETEKEELQKLNDDFNNKFCDEKLKKNTEEARKKLCENETDCASNPICKLDKDICVAKSEEEINKQMGEINKPMDEKPKIGTDSREDTKEYNLSDLPRYTQLEDESQQMLEQTKLTNTTESQASQSNSTTESQPQPLSQPSQHQDAPENPGYWFRSEDIKLNQNELNNHPNLKRFIDNKSLLYPHPPTQIGNHSVGSPSDHPPAMAKVTTKQGNELIVASYNLLASGLSDDGFLVDDHEYINNKLDDKSNTEPNTKKKRVNNLFHSINNMFKQGVALVATQENDFYDGLAREFNDYNKRQEKNETIGEDNINITEYFPINKEINNSIKNTQATFKFMAEDNNKTDGKNDIHQGPVISFPDNIKQVIVPKYNHGKSNSVKHGLGIIDEALVVYYDSNKLEFISGKKKELNKDLGMYFGHLKFNIINKNDNDTTTAGASEELDVIIAHLTSGTGKNKKIIKTTGQSNQEEFKKNVEVREDELEKIGKVTKQISNPCIVLMDSNHCKYYDILDRGDLENNFCKILTCNKIIRGPPCFKIRGHGSVQLKKVGESIIDSIDKILTKNCKKLSKMYYGSNVFELAPINNLKLAKEHREIIALHCRGKNELPNDKGAINNFRNNGHIDLETMNYIPKDGTTENIIKKLNTLYGKN